MRFLKHNRRMPRRKYINLLYHKDKQGYGNFGDELSVFITTKLVNHKKYKLLINKPGCLLNIICIGSYIHKANDNTYIYGSGIRLINNTNIPTNINVFAIRGPKTRDFLMSCNINNVPEIYGDPALLLPLFYKPKVISNLSDKIAVIPHKSHYEKYMALDTNKFELINPTDKWHIVVDKLVSCKSIISSSLHGLVCADAYKKPNMWLYEYDLSEGKFKFEDYMASQSRPVVFIQSLANIDETQFYMGGNTINLQQLKDAFPFK